LVREYSCDRKYVATLECYIQHATVKRFGPRKEYRTLDAYGWAYDFRTGVAKRVCNVEHEQCVVLGDEDAAAV
jgi:hypothetical protein